MRRSWRPGLRVARFREDFFASASGLRLAAVAPAVGDRVQGFAPVAGAENAWRQRAVRDDAAPVQEDRGYSSMSTAIEIAWRSLRALQASADHRILHVEAEVVPSPRRRW